MSHQTDRSLTSFNLLIQIDLLNKQLDKLDPGEEQEKVDEKIS